MTSNYNGTIALIKRGERSPWVSCQSITQNLSKAYNKAFTSRLNKYHVEDCFNDYDFFCLAEKLIADKVSEVVWVDHSPHPGPLIRSLSNLCERKNISPPIFNIHIFGDFTLDAQKWAAIGSSLKNFKTRFICASRKQAQLVENLTSSKVEVIPFPVDKESFFFSQNKRDEFRNRYGLEGSDHALIYTGRISIQKNVIELVNIFKSLLSSLPPRTTLFLAGPLDDLGIPFIGRRGVEGSFYNVWQEQLGDINLSSTNGEVVFLGDLSHQELYSLYCGGDTFISLSTHNDEDYGMSPAEALTSGLPCILSDWGGYSSFGEILNNEQHCRLIPVQAGEKRIHPDFKRTQKEILLATARGELSEKNREEFANKSSEHFSIMSVAKKIEGLYQRPANTFTGYSKNLYKLASCFKMSPEAPFLSRGGGYSDFYREIYNVYWESAHE